jgi:hypothetical protein
MHDAAVSDGAQAAPRTALHRPRTLRLPVGGVRLQRQRWQEDPQNLSYRAEAAGWRGDAAVAVRKRTLPAPASTTLGEAAQAWLDGAREGVIRPRSGEPHKPAASRHYERGLRLRVLPSLGARKLASIEREHLQALVDRLTADGASAALIEATANPLRAIYRHAMRSPSTDGGCGPVSRFIASCMRLKSTEDVSAAPGTEMASRQSVSWPEIEPIVRRRGAPKQQEGNGVPWLRRSGRRHARTPGRAGAAHVWAAGDVGEPLAHQRIAVTLGVCKLPLRDSQTDSVMS